MNNSTLDSVRISVLTEEEIIRTSVCEISVPEIYDSRDLPVEGGLADRRLGVIKYHEVCATCEKSLSDCSGHIGHITLARPVFNPMFLTTVESVLNQICSSCGRRKNLAAVVKKTEEEGSNTFSDEKTCTYCGSESGKTYKIKNPYFIQQTVSKELITASVVYDIFQKITKETLSELNEVISCKPVDLLIRTLLVPSIRDRPTIIMDSGVRNENDLSFKLLEIIRSNRKLKTHQQDDSIGNHYYELLQYHVASYMNNELSDLPVSRHLGSDRPIVGVIQRLKGKYGRIRSNSVAKRVDFCLRTTITPNPEIGMDEVVVPKEVANKLTIPQTINKHNREFFLNELRTQTGLISTIKSDDKTKTLVLSSNLDDCMQLLRPGSVIERHLMDGDYIILNRQPTLHKLGLLAHKVVIKDQLTLSVNGGICAPYNADFDGDEMNGHVVQNQASYTELERLLNLKNNLVSPKTSRPSYGAVEDYLAGLFILTSSSRRLSLHTANRLLHGIDFDFKRVRAGCTGHDVFSSLLPTNLCLNTKNGLGETVEIEDGVLRSGQIDKALVGINGIIFHKVAMLYDEDLHFKLFCDLCRLGQNTVDEFGLTANLEEYNLGDTGAKELSEFKNTKMKELHQNDTSVDTQSQSRALKIIHEFRIGCGKLIKSSFNSKKQNIYYITSSGAKGSSMNFLQITGAIGQQAVAAGRISGDFSPDRVYSCSTENSRSKDKGFIASSYAMGMDATEYFSSSIAARESLIDVQLKTKKSGYAERRLTHALQDLKTTADLAVRTSEKRIINFAAGDRGVDPTKYSSDFGMYLDNYFSFDASDIGAEPESVEVLESVFAGLSFKIPELKVNLISESIRLKCTAVALERALSDIQYVLDYYNVCPHNPVGIVSAQSLAEPLSQMTLNSLNESGTRGEGSYKGISKIIKLIDNSDSHLGSVSRIHIPEADPQTSRRTIEDVLNVLVPVFLGDFEQTVDTDREQITIRLDRRELNTIGFSGSDTRKIFDAIVKKISTIRAAGDLDIVYNKCSENEFTMCLSSNTKNALKFSELLQAVQTKFRLKGLLYYMDHTILRKQNSVIIQIEGCKIKSVIKKLNTSLPGVRLEYSSNSVKDVFELAGIEAARSTLIDELNSVYTSQGISLDPVHTRLLADAMCHAGAINSIGRRGIVKQKNSFLAKSAFEMPDKVLSTAAVRGEVDPLSGVLQNIMTGVQVQIGTSMYKTKL